MEQLDRERLSVLRAQQEEAQDLDLKEAALQTEIDKVREERLHLGVRMRAQLRKILEPELPPRAA